MNFLFLFPLFAFLALPYFPPDLVFVCLFQFDLLLFFVCSFANMSTVKSTTLGPYLMTKYVAYIPVRTSPAGVGSINAAVNTPAKLTAAFSAPLSFS